MTKDIPGETSTKECGAAKGEGGSKLDVTKLSGSGTPVSSFGSNITMPRTPAQKRGLKHPKRDR